MEFTNQDVAKGTERVHAQLAPLVGEKSVLQPLVDHGVDFLQPARRSTHDVSRAAMRRTKRRTVGRIDGWMGWGHRRLSGHSASVSLADSLRPGEKYLLTQ